ncbi:MAG: hypothetical protein NTW86_00795 [Candidatus Sumerlaeota bacterium]|nr:hypothetical protein [Candidatus Sumerlaeota bacterium]
MHGLLALLAFLCATARAGDAGPTWSNDPPHHQHMAYQGYLMLPDSPIKTEIGHYIGEARHYTGDGDSGSLICEGADEEDFVHNDWEIITGTARYFRHFWDPDGGYNAGINILGPHDSNVKTAQSYWGQAISLYATDPGTAYWHLGRMIHLIQDACQPAHSHNDPHDDIVNPEQMEDFAAAHYTEWDAQKMRAGSVDQLSPYPLSAIDYEALPAQIANSGGIDYSTLPAAQRTRLFRLFLNAAETADDFESERVDADVDSIQFNLPASTIAWHAVGHPAPAPGSFTDAELYLHADTLVPLAMRYSAGIMVLFWDTTHPTVDFQYPASGAALRGVASLRARSRTMDALAFSYRVNGGAWVSLGSVVNSAYAGDRRRRFNASLDTRAAGIGLLGTDAVIFRVEGTNADGFSALAEVAVSVNNRSSAGEAWMSYQ